MHPKLRTREKVSQGRNLTRKPLVVADVYAPNERKLTILPIRYAFFFSFSLTLLFLQTFLPLHPTPLRFFFSSSAIFFLLHFLLLLRRLCSPFTLFLFFPILSIVFLASFSLLLLPFRLIFFTTRYSCLSLFLSFLPRCSPRLISFIKAIVPRFHRLFPLLIRSLLSRPVCSALLPSHGALSLVPLPAFN